MVDLVAERKDRLGALADGETGCSDQGRQHTLKALAAFWQDPDFDSESHAFYYARVLEIPTPRWTTYDAVRLGADVPEAAPEEIQDRAYTSPIWYTP